MIELETGELTFSMRDADGKETKRWSGDLIELKLTAEEIETKHSLQSSNGYLIPTRAFLRDLAAAYSELGAEGCTPATAKLIWIHVAGKFLELSMKTEQQVLTMMQSEQPKKRKRWFGIF